MRVFALILWFFASKFLFGSTYTLEYALSGHQIHTLQSESYDLVVGSELPASFGIGNISEESELIDSAITENLSAEHTYLDLWTDYLTGESAILLWQGAPLREPMNDWKHAKWFGYYYGTDYPWVYNFPLGWLYVEESLKDGVWLWHGSLEGREKLGWMWTSAERFPYFYLPSINRWTFYKHGQIFALFYDYETQEWFDSNVPYNLTFSTNLNGAGYVDGIGDYYRWEKVQVSVNPYPKYNFAGWSGEYYKFPESFEIQVLGHSNLHANFVPLVSGVSQVSEVMNYAVDVIYSMEDLTEVQKERSIAELLKFGSSPTAGFSVVEK